MICYSKGWKKLFVNYNWLKNAKNSIWKILYRLKKDHAIAEIANENFNHYVVWRK